MFDDHYLTFIRMKLHFTNFSYFSDVLFSFYFLIRTWVVGSSDVLTIFYETNIVTKCSCAMHLRGL